MCLSGGGCFLFESGGFVAFPADTDEFGDAGLLHGDAVKNGTGFHGFAVVGDDDELRLAAHVADEAREAADVGFVERSIYFVEDTEGAWLIAEYGDEQRERGHGFFAAGEQEDVLHAFARRRSNHVDAGVAGAVDLGEAHFRHAASEDGVESFGEICVDGVEGLFEFFARDQVEFGDRLLCVGDGLEEIIAFTGQERESLLALVELFESHHVDGAHGFDALLHFAIIRFRDGEFFAGHEGGFRGDQDPRVAR